MYVYMAELSFELTSPFEKLRLFLQNYFPLVVKIVLNYALFIKFPSFIICGPDFLVAKTIKNLQSFVKIDTQ